MCHNGIYKKGQTQYATDRFLILHAETKKTLVQSVMDLFSKSSTIQPDYFDAVNEQRALHMDQVKPLKSCFEVYCMRTGCLLVVPQPKQITKYAPISAHYTPSHLPPSTTIYLAISTPPVAPVAFLISL